MPKETETTTGYKRPPVVVHFIPQFGRWYLSHERSLQSAAELVWVNGFSTSQDAIEQAQKHGYDVVRVDGIVGSTPVKTKIKKYRIDLEVTSAVGHQTMEVEAITTEEALKFFKGGLSKLVDSEVEVTDLSPWNAEDIYEYEP